MDLPFHPFLVHFPIAFPEIFVSEKKGFDVIIGNPPWEKATVEEDAFWARHFPGLHAFNTKDKKNEIIDEIYERKRE